MEKNMQSRDILSVIVPVYNVETYLDRCVESLVNQTYKDLEIILVDDGSPDRCPEMCDQWAGRDQRIKVIHKINGGLSDARNAGIDVADGEYIAFVDSDDYVDLHMYETMIAALKEKQANIACCGRYIVKGEAKIAMHTMDAQATFTAKDAIKELLIGGFVEESACDKVYRRNLFRGIHFPKGETNEDIAIMPKLISRAEKVVHVGKPFYYYWQNNSSITRSQYSPQKRIMLKHLDDVEQYLRETHVELLPYFEVLQNRYCQSVLYLLLDNRKIYREFQEDYKEFYRRFKRSFLPSIRLGRASAMEKFKGLLVYINLYQLLHAIKKGRIRI